MVRQDDAVSPGNQGCVELGSVSASRADQTHISRRDSAAAADPSITTLPTPRCRSNSGKPRPLAKHKTIIDHATAGLNLRGTYRHTHRSCSSIAFRIVGASPTSAQPRGCRSNQDAWNNQRR